MGEPGVFVAQADSTANHAWGPSVVIASGPSLTEADVAYCQGQARVLVVNDNWRLAPWADALYASDHEWWLRHGGVEEFKGERWTQSRAAAEKWGLRWIPGEHKDGLSTDPGKIHFGHNSGFAALNLAVLFGSREIVLLGFDLQRTGGNDHWFGPHPAGLARVSPFHIFRKQFEIAAPQLVAMGVRVVNATRVTALECFDRCSLEEGLGGFTREQAGRGRVFGETASAISG